MSVFALLLMLPTIEEFEAKSDWSERDRQQALAVAVAHRENWEICVRGSRVKLLRKQASADIIATAVSGYCLQKQEVYRRALTISFRGLLEPGAREDAANRIISERRNSMKEETIAAVLTAQ